MTRAGALLGATMLALALAAGCDAVLGLDDYHLRETSAAGGSAGHGSGGSGGAPQCTPSCDGTCEWCFDPPACAPKDVYQPDDENCMPSEVCDGALTCAGIDHYFTTNSQEGFAVDARAGRVAIAGLFTDTAGFGSDVLKDLDDDGPDIFVAVHEPGGTVRGVAVQATLVSEISGVALSAEGIVYVAGTLAEGGVLSAEGAPAAGANGSDIFILRVDTNYDTAAHVIESAGNQWARGVAVSNTGEVAVVGGFETHLAAENAPCATTLSPNSALADVLVAVYDGQITSCLGRSSFGTAGLDEATAVAFGVGDTLVVGGRYSASHGDMTVLGQQIVDQGGQPNDDLFVVAIDTSNTWTATWATNLVGNALDDELHDLATDGNGNVVVTGLHNGTDLTVNGAPVGWNVAPELHPFLVELAAGNGSFITGRPFAHLVQTPSSTRLRVAIGAGGSIVLGGVFEGPADFGGGELGSVAHLHPFTAVFSGEAPMELYSQRVHRLEIGSDPMRDHFDVAADRNDSRAYLGGTFNGSLTLRIDVPGSIGHLESSDNGPDVILLDYAQ